MMNHRIALDREKSHATRSRTNFRIRPAFRMRGHSSYSTEKGERNALQSNGCGNRCQSNQVDCLFKPLQLITRRDSTAPSAHDGVMLDGVMLAGSERNDCPLSDLIGPWP